MPKVIHIGNTAGVPTTLARFQGHEDVVCFNSLQCSLFGGRRVVWHNPFSRYLFLKSLKQFDILHYHYPYGTLWRELKKLRKKLVLHFHGQDLRNIGRYDDPCLVATPDLLPRAPNGTWLKTPLDLDFYRQFQGDSDGKTVVYYPAHKNQKIEDHVSKPLHELEKQGKINLVETLGFSYPDLMKVMSKAAVIVGKINYDMGWIGKFELEAMALGKPVIAYVSDELYDKYHPPVYRTTKETFKDDLLAMLQSDSQKLGERGREYVKQHDARLIVKELEEYYKK